MGRLRFEPEHLVEGLTFDERLHRLEAGVRGTKHVPGLQLEHERLVARVEELESLERRRQMPWYLRLLFRGPS